MQIKWLRTALINLDQEVENIAKDDPQAAHLVLQRTQHTVALLANNPNLGHPGRLPGTHELAIPTTRYIIPYRVRPRLDRIEILRIFRASRMPAEHW